jgi:hypothetical protein
MKIHKAEVGSRYSDDSGWERRVCMDIQKNTLDVELGGSTLHATADEARWLFDALQELLEVLEA